MDSCLTSQQEGKEKESLRKGKLHLCYKSIVFVAANCSVSGESYFFIRKEPVGRVRWKPFQIFSYVYVFFFLIHLR